MASDAVHPAPLLRERDYLKTGGQNALADLYSAIHAPMRAMIQQQLDRRLTGRLDPSDVLQDAYVELARRINSFLTAPSIPFYVWARQVTRQTLLSLQRRHFGQKRHPNFDVRLESGDNQQPVGDITSPSEFVMRGESATALSAAIEQLDSIDQEILWLRHFEELGNNEAAECLGIGKTAASNRYVRALNRLGAALGVSRP